MLRRIVRVSAPLTLMLPALAALFGGCRGRDLTVAIANESEVPSFTAPDADVEAEAGPIAYCPTNKCPSGRRTCPNSRFPCDVNLLSDVNNCGACDFACPASGFNATYSCVNGQCVGQCAPTALDCDGLPDNGCEAFTLHNDHCGACNKKCSDPAAPCSWQGSLRQDLDCGCPAGMISCSRQCVDGRNDDANCGRCGNVCSPTGDGKPERTNAYYGCVNGECGTLKCVNGFGDCDSDPLNGCETSTLTAENCGGCGIACPNGQQCRLDEYGTPQCMCPPGLTRCEKVCRSGSGSCAACVDLASDKLNCGGCDVACTANAPFANKMCSYGTCVAQCMDNHADCNNSEVDGCEVDIASDPRNCGGCGIVCDAVAGQACVAGRCLVEPCDEQHSGEGAR